MGRVLFVGLISVVSLLSNFPNQETTTPYNVPDGLSACLKARPGLEINTSINPYYISGDFDGDGFTDIAVQVKTSKDKRQGILLCLANRDSTLVGAAQALPWKEDVVPFDEGGNQRFLLSSGFAFDILRSFSYTYRFVRDCFAL